MHHHKAFAQPATRNHIRQLSAVRLAHLQLTIQQQTLTGIAAPWEDETAYATDAICRLLSASSDAQPDWIAVRVCGTDTYWSGLSGLGALTGMRQSSYMPWDNEHPLPHNGCGIVVVVDLHRTGVERPCGALAFWHDSTDNGSLILRTEMLELGLFGSLLLQFAEQSEKPVGLDTDLLLRRQIAPLSYWQLHLSDTVEEPIGECTFLVGYRGSDPEYRRSRRNNEVLLNS